MNKNFLQASCFVPPQQSTGLGTLDYAAVVEMMKNVKNTKSRGTCTKFIDVGRL